jgi:hypothetical protein
LRYFESCLNCGCRAGGEPFLHLPWYESRVAAGPTFDSQVQVQIEDGAAAPRLGNAGNADAQCDASCTVSLIFQESQVSFSIFIMFWYLLYFFVSWLKVDVLQMVSWQAFPCPGRDWCFFTIKVATASDFGRGPPCPLRSSSYRMHRPWGRGSFWGGFGVTLW